MVKVLEQGEEVPPAPPPTVTLTPTPLVDSNAHHLHLHPYYHHHHSPPMGVPPSPSSSLSASGPVSPASSVNSTGEAFTQDDPRPYCRPHNHYYPWGPRHHHYHSGPHGPPPHSRRHHSPHHHHHYYYHHHHNNNNNNNNNNNSTHNYNYRRHNNTSPTSSGGSSSSQTGYHNHHHHNHNHSSSINGNGNNDTTSHTNGGPSSSPHDYHHHNHHTITTGGHHYHHGRGHHYHQPECGYHSYKGGYHDSYGGYYSGYPGGGGRGRYKGPRDDSWAVSIGVAGRGRGRHHKSMSPKSRSRGSSPHPHATPPCFPSPPHIPMDETPMSSFTVEVGGSGGLAGLGGGEVVYGMGVEDLGVSWEEAAGQYVVLLHINPGLTVNFTENGHVQRISGPASVRMVSANSSPPIPLPVQVPPGHVVQQIVDETGTLRHVILSAQPVPMPMCPYGPNTGQGPPPYHYGPPPPGPPPQSYGSHFQPPPQYPPIMSPPLAQTSPPPPFAQKPERHLRQCEKPRPSKYYPRQPHQNTKSGSSSLQSTPPLSPKKEPVPKKTTGEEEVQGEDGEDPRNTLQHLLSQVKPPKVVEVTPHKAVLQWVAPDLAGRHEELGVTELHYEVFLNDNSYNTINTTQLTIADLIPATDYRVFFHCLCESVRGDTSGVTSFRTEPTVPGPPQLPKMVHKTKTSLQFRWTTNHLKDNGSRVSAFILEIYGSNGEWSEAYRGKNKQHTISKLQPNTRYRVRLAAVNDLGKSDYSTETVAYTSGVVPSQPPSPILEHATVTSLSLGWSKRPTDDSYTLQMEDSLNGYGFQPVYNGQETRFVCQSLRRNTYYRFRLSAQNEEGSSPYSEVATYPTLPDRPKPPSPPSVKGRPKSSRLIVMWGSPVDNGGSPVTSYRLEMDRGSGFECVYSGEKMEAECTDLTPGKSYHVRVQCKSIGGKSDWSEVSTVTTEAVCPGVCQSPRLLGKPKASQLQLKWSDPDHDGGAPIMEFHIDMTAPDNDRRQVYRGRDHECTVASLLPGRPYFFLVRGVNRIGPGPWSDPLEVLSGAGPPDTPHPPHLACRSPHSVHLNWDEPINNGAGIEQYNIQVAEVSCLHAESSESSSTCGDPESDLTFTSAYTGSATTTEVRNLSPATTYAFRVCCSNSAGVSAWSSPATVTTPAAPPAPVTYISSSPAATTIALVWGEPASHGDPITHYVIEVGDRTVTTPGPETEFTLSNMLPETLYKIRIQAMNSVGPGGFSAIHKVTTRPLPPAPPSLELVKASYNSLKLKWGDGRNLDMLNYSLQMEFTNQHNGNKEFYQVYSGTNQNYKVARLDENTKYHLRICASNEAGTGPFSPIATLATTKAPPPLIKAPRVTETPEGSHLVEWCSVRCPGEDSITYRLQMLQAGKDQDYSVVYNGSETSHSLTHLEPNSGYYVRVCGVRVCTNGDTMAGAYSSPTLFNTPKPAPVATTKPTVNTSQDVGFQWQRLSDQQKAAVILTIFSLFCAFAAIGLHHFLAPDNSR